MSDENLMLSLAMTDHYFDVATLERIGRDVKLGDLPELDEDTRAGLLPQVQRMKAMLGLGRAPGEVASPEREATPWWRFCKIR
jgi:hypothetical protein